jgi:hypothetical protein
MNSAITPTSNGEAVDPRHILEDFIRDIELQRLELLLGKFNLFEALKLVWHEVRHSDFLAYLLDPQQNHGLRDSFLKAVLQEALTGCVNGVTPIDIDVWNLTSAEVRREWQNIDIFVRDETNHLAVIIENKIQSTEHGNQLARYYECVKKECVGWKIVSIYLTIERESPLNEQYIALGYDQVCQLIESLVALRRNAIDADVRVMVEHYAEMLRRHILSESEISGLCRKIYDKHKQALDLIYEHRPDRLQVAKECLERLISDGSDLVLVGKGKSNMRFLPKVLDTDVLRKGDDNASSGRILLFWVENFEESLAVKLVIGPGLSETREKLFQIAKFNPRLFASSLKLFPQWTTVYKHKLLGRPAYALTQEEFVGALEQEWAKFIEKDLPPLVAVFDSATWIHDENDQKSGIQADTTV